MDKDLRVVNIISPYKVVLNSGQNGGLKRNDIVVIYGISKETIKDIKPGYELEKLEIVRGRGKIIHVQEKICTVESIETSKSGKRIVKSFKGLQGFMSPTEEIVYDDDRLPFEEPQIGDFAKIEHN